MTSTDGDEFVPASDTEQLTVELVRKGTKWLDRASINADSRDVIKAEAADLRSPFARASRWAKEGRIFGIKLDGSIQFPAYAFDQNGQPVPTLYEVLQILTEISPFAIAAWFESPSSMLGGKRPRELLASDGEAVIAAARALREGPSHG